MHAKLSAFAVVMLCAVAASAQEAAKDTAKEPSGEELVGLIGGRFEKVFNVCGVPIDLPPTSNASGEHRVCMMYANHALNIHNKKVLSCMFWPEFQGTVRGVRMDATSEDVIKLLGEPKKRESFKDGSETLYWDDKEDDRMLLMIEFGNDHKISRLVENLK